MFGFSYLQAELCPLNSIGNPKLNKYNGQSPRAQLLKLKSFWEIWVFATFQESCIDIINHSKTNFKLKYLIIIKKNLDEDMFRRLTVIMNSNKELFKNNKELVIQRNLVKRYESYASTKYIKEYAHWHKKLASFLLPKPVKLVNRNWSNNIWQAQHCPKMLKQRTP